MFLVRPCQLLQPPTAEHRIFTYCAWPPAQTPAQTPMRRRTPPLLTYAAALAPVLEAYLSVKDCAKLALQHTELGAFVGAKRQRVETELRDLALRLFRGMMTPHLLTKSRCTCEECQGLRGQHADGYETECFKVGWVGQGQAPRPTRPSSY